MKPKKPSNQDVIEALERQEPIVQQPLDLDLLAAMLTIGFDDPNVRAARRRREGLVTKT